MTLAGSGKKVVSVREQQKRLKELKREQSRKMLLESLEGRQLMAVGPQLIGVQPNEGTLLQNGTVLHVSPKELVFRFDDSAAIDASTLSGIQLTRAGADGIFERAYISTDLGTGGQVVLDFAAATPGLSGNGIELKFTKVSRTDSSLPVLTVEGQRINIEVNTNPLFKTSAADLLTAFSNSGPASSLVLATRLRGSQFTSIADTVPTTQVLTLSGANAAKASTNLNAGTNLQVEFVAQAAGPSGRNIQIVVTSRDRGGPASPVVTVSGTTISVEMNSNSRNATTAQELVDAINNDSAASALVLARFVSGTPATRVGGLVITYSPIVLTGANDIPVVPAYVGLGDTNREVIFRFAEDLPDDVYRIDILGRGNTALRNADGLRFNGGVDRSLQFELDLGAKIQSIVPQPIVRLANGTLDQKRNEIHVYFNDDDLNVASAQNPAFYQLRYTRDTISSNDDVIINPSRVEYDAKLDRAILTFNRNLDQLVDSSNNPLPIGALRLRIGTNEGQLPAPTSLNVAVDPGSRFASASDISGSFNPSAGQPKSIILSSEILNSTPYLLDFPGANDEIGNRDNRYQSHVTRVDADGIQVIEYNFQGQLGQANGSVQLNAITDVQKNLVRQIMSLYSNYLGVRFVETDSRGLTVAVGDMQAVAGGTSNQPGGLKLAAGSLVSNGQSAVVIDIQDFNSATQNEFGTDLFRSFMQGIGLLLGLGTAEELPNLTVQNNQPISSNTELVFPGNQDIVHGQFVLRPEGKDIDLYRFTLPEAGELKLETFAERLSDSSLLDSVIRLYQLQADGSYKEIASNDDYYSEDSLVRVHVPAGSYVVGVSAKGNDSYDPNVEDSGLGGRSEGRYQLRIDFRPPESSFMVDSNADGDLSDVRIDGDGDGRPGGTYDFWFVPTGPNNTIFVDKASTAATANGSLATPYKNIKDALLVATSGKVVRIVGNGGTDGKLETTNDNLAYEIGFNRLGQAQADGTTFDVPRDVTVMIDAGAILKLSRARISVGSSSVSVNRSGGALQSLGIPRLIDSSGNVIYDLNGDAIPGSVFFTSLNDTIGKGSNLDRTPPAAAPGDWGGIDFRNQIDGNDESRKDLERSGLFLNSIVHSNIKYGGGQVVVDGVSQVITPIHMLDSRPTISYNTISLSADAAMAATPNSFRESNFQDPRSQATGSFIADFERVGPSIHGNLVVGNSINGLFVKVRTAASSNAEVMSVPGRFDDTDIVHVISENLVISGTPGGSLQDSVSPPTSIVTLSTLAVGSLAAGSYNYKLVYVDAAGNESIASEATASITVAANGSIVLNNLPPARSDLQFVSRRIYRSAVGGTGPYSFVAQIDGVSSTFTDNGSVTGAPLVESAGRLRPRLNGSLTIDPGTIVKLQGSRIEVQFGAQLLAEGTDGLPVVMTSADDKRFGAGGSFDTVKRPQARTPVAGDWGGIYVGHTSSLSMDYAKVAFGGGTTRIDGGFASFNTIEIHQAEARIAHSRFENNADGSTSTTDGRAGRGSNGDGVIFVRGAQPVILDNRITDNAAAPINIDVNSLNWEIVTDHGRSTGRLGATSASIDNQGPLVEGNRLARNGLNGMLVRGQTLTTQSVWDDTDMVHIVLDTITVSDFHTYGGLRLESKPASSLVVKFQGQSNVAGLNATGTPLDNANRIGGAIQIVGQSGFPVIMTSLTDDTVGAGFTPEGLPNLDSDNISASGVTRLPTGPEQNNGTLIDNDVAVGVPGQFAFQVLPGGESGFGGGITAQGNTQLLSNIDVVFDFINYVDIGSNGGGINLGTSTITQPPTLVSPDLVISRGTFQGANGLVRWTVESRFDNGIAKLINTVRFDSDTALGNLQFINYLDEDVQGVSDDLLYLTGTPGQPNFRAYTLDGPERIGFNQGGEYIASSDLVNATYTGWAADRFADLRSAITGNGTQYTVPGNIDTSDLVPFNDAALGQVYGLADVTTAFAWNVDPAANSAVITTFLELVPTNPATKAVSGDWNGVTLQTYSNDRNVSTTTEREASGTESIGTNDIPSSSQFLGTLASSANSGDENSRLGFELHGTISKPSDVDVYSFVAKGGTEIWIDIDRTANSLDTVVELVDANGRILALSDNSGSEETLGSITYRDTELSADSVHPMRKSAAQLYPTDSRGNPRDLYSTNPKDAGFRVVLPGQSNISTLYHVRVRSSNIGPGDAVSKLSDPAELRSGKSSGVYQMQIRLGETDEIPGSSFNYADVRYAVNGLTLSGVPRHSPLVGETSEQESRDTNADGTVDVPNNDAFARAQELGNILATDRATISVAGSLSSPTDVDWYSFTIDYQLLLTPLAEYLSTVFDIDYADGIGRPDTSMYLFDSNGRLVSLGLNSNILDDRAGPLRGADNGDLSRGSSGTLDAYLGSVELPAGRYFLAVTNSGNVPAALAGFTSAGATNPLVRLQPASNTQLIVEDHVGSDGGSTATAPIVPQFVDSNSVVQWTLGDIPLYVSRDTGLNSTEVYIVNPFTGQVSNNVTVGGRIGLDIRDIAFRANGTLQAFDTSAETLITGDRDPLSRYISIDYGTGATTIVGNSGIETYHPGATAGTTVDSNSGMTIEALTIATLNNAEVGFFVANRDLGPQATDYNDNIVYRFNTATGTAVSVNTDRVVVNNFDQKLLGAGTQITEVGRISTSTPAGVSRRLVVTEATLVNGSSTNRLLLDGARFTIRDSANFPATFEFNSGPELLLNYNQYTGRIMRDGDVFTIDGVNYEFDTGGTLVISATTGAGIADGSTVSITDILGVTKTFEFDSNNSLVNPANIRVAYTAASTQAQLTSALVSAINSAGFASVASVNPGSNRISVANKSTSVSMTVTGSGLLIDGTRGVGVGNQRIAITETMTQAQFVDAIRSAMPSTIIVGHDGTRVNFSGALSASFASFAARGVGIDLGTSGGVTAGNIAINFLAEDTQETIAIRVAAAINGAAIAGVSAVANGRDVNLSNATIDTSPARTPSSPLKVGDIAPGGRITGMTLLDATDSLFAVSNTGGLYRISSNFGFGVAGGSFTTAFVNTATDLLGIQFTGLTAGPRNLENGRYANLLFGTDINGNIWAFNTRGELQPVFANGASFIATGQSGLNGLAFSTLDYNLWHTTSQRGGDAGHGLPAMPDASRPASAGGQSWYFGFEDPFSGAHPNATYSVSQDPVIRDSINFPGGAQGVLETKPFNLAGLSAADQPYLYFNYWLQTQNSNSDLTDVNVFMQDSFRVYAGTEDGNWIMLTTNNSDTGPNLADDEFDTAISGSTNTQEAFDTANWRQARVNLSQLAGQSNVRLRFEFSTAGSMGFGQTGGRGPEVRLLAGSRLQDGQTMTIGGTTFEIEMGASVVMPSGLRLRNGDTVTVEGVNFVFYNGIGTPPATGTIIPFSANWSSEQVAQALFNAIQSATYPAPVTGGFNFSDETIRANDTSNAATVAPITGASMTLLGTGAIGDNPAFAATPDRDVDLVKIQLSRGASITVTTSTSAAIPKVDTYLRLFDSFGNELASNNDFGASSDSRLTFTATADGVYYIGISASSNNRYSPVVAGTSLPGGSTGIYDLRIDVTQAFNPQIDGARILLGGAKNVQVTSDSAIIKQGDAGTVGVPVYVDLDDTANQVGIALRNALAAQFANNRQAVYDLRGDFINLTGLTVANAGPFGVTRTRNEDLFSEYSITNGLARPALRAQNNAVEGLYLDDFIIGVAERGELVLDGDTTTAFVPNPAGATGIQVGEYQLEIRGGEEFGQPTTTGINLVSSFAANARLVSGQNLVFRPGSQIGDGATIRLSDGIKSLTLEFEDTLGANGVTPGNVPVPFQSTFTAAQIAAAVRNIVNSSLVQSVLQVTASMVNGDLTGATSDTLAFFGNATVVADPVVATLVVVDAVGDRNTPREQGQIVVENSKFSHSSGFGIRLSADPRDAGSDNPNPGAVRNTVVLNNQRLIPGAVVMNNELLYNTAGGISITGDTAGANRVAAPVPFARIVNNTIVGGTVAVDEAADPQIYAGINFAIGQQSFADGIVSYNPLQAGGPAPIVALQDTTKVLGAPDYTSNVEPIGGTGAVSLGHGGQLIVRFNDNYIRSSGDSRPDLFISEVGDAEMAFVAVSSDGLTYKNVGKIGGNIKTIDLDAFGIKPNEQITFVRLIDDVNQGATTGDSVGADIDAIGGIFSALRETYTPSGTGILVGENASPTLLNNVIVNAATGISVVPSSSSTVIGGNLFQRNTNNVSGAATVGQFPMLVNSNSTLFVDPVAEYFYPFQNSVLIDSSIDSLADRSSLVAVKQPLGLQTSPILAPSLDINGLLRVDDPTVDTPSGLGDNVFKDRGASDRSDSFGPSTFVLAPIDNDSAGSDLNAEEGIVEISNRSLPYFDIQLIDAVRRGGVSEGSGMLDKTVTSSAILVFRNNKPLIEGVDYRFGYDATNGVVRLTPLAGVWASDAVYTIRLLNKSASTITLRAPSTYADGTSYTVTDANGVTTAFELDFGYLMQVPSNTSGIHQITDGSTVTLDDGSSRVTFEFDMNSAITTGNLPVVIEATDTAEAVAQKLVAAIRTRGLAATATSLGTGAIQLQGTGSLRIVTNNSPLIITGQPGATPGYGLQIPAIAGVPSGVTDGQSFSIRLGNGGTATFEFDNNGVVQPGRVAVSFTNTSTLNDIANSIVSAISRSGLGLSPANVGNGLVTIGGDANVRLDATASVLSVVGNPGQSASTIIKVDMSITKTESELANLVASSIRSANLSGVTLTVFGSRILVEGAIGVTGSGAAIVSAITDVAGNPLRANQTNGDTVVLIQLGEGRDYGDAPDPRYHSTNANNGARHVIVPGFSLGASVTVDGDARLTDADVDDGVTFASSIYQAFRTSITVTAQGVSAATPGYITVWIDYDQDGDFENNTERLFVGRQITNASETISNILVPSTALSGNTYARIRLARVASEISSSVGEANSGEVEDYAVTILANPYSNPNNRLDVSGDGFVSPIDALQVLNFLNLNGMTTLSVPVNRPVPPYLDTNGDGVVSSLDALLVINYLNLRAAGGEGEGESEGSSMWIAAQEDKADSNELASTMFIGPAATQMKQDTEDGISLEQYLGTPSRREIGPVASGSVLDAPVNMAIEDFLDDLSTDVAEDAKDDQLADVFANPFWEDLA